MATIYGSIKGVHILREAPSQGTGGLALVTFEMPAYTAASDNGQLGGGGYDGNTATTSSLAAILQGRRRDGKTVNLRSSSPGCHAETGLTGSTEFYAGTLAVSGSNITFNVENAAGTEINAASGVVDRPMAVVVAYYLS